MTIQVAWLRVLTQQRSSLLPATEETKGICQVLLFLLCGAESGIYI